MPILQAAHLFQMQGLVTKCEIFMADNMEPNRCLEYLRHAELFNLDSRVIEVSHNCIQTHFAIISPDQMFLDLPKNVIHQFISNDGIKCPEVEVFKTIVRWINHEEGRQEHLEELFSSIRLALLDTQTLFTDVACAPLIQKSPQCQKLIQDALLYHNSLYEQPLYRGTLNRVRGVDGIISMTNTFTGPRPQGTFFERNPENDSTFFFHTIPTENQNSPTEPVKLKLNCPLILGPKPNLLTDPSKTFLFVIGVDSRSVSNVMWRLDTRNGKWLQLQGVPFDALIWSTACLLDNDSILLVGGVMLSSTMEAHDISEATNKVWKYDIKRNTWIQKQEYPYMVYGALACVCQGKMYVIGGKIKMPYTGSSASNKVYCYDPAMDVWLKKPDAIFKFHEPEASILAVGNYILVGSGYRGTINFHYYTVEDNQWSIITTSDQLIRDALRDRYMLKMSKYLRIYEIGNEIYIALDGATSKLMVFNREDKTLKPSGKMGIESYRAFCSLRIPHLYEGETV